MPGVLWLVAARSGSKGIRHKNIRPLGGVPLMAHRIREALKIAPASRVWVSTDSPRYARLARRYGATVPFLRPPALASDAARSVDVVLHAMRTAEDRGMRFDAVGLLEPTSPFVAGRDLRRAVAQLLADPKADAVVAVRRVRPASFYVQSEARYLGVLARRFRSAGSLRRQDERPEITPSGGFYIARWERFKRLRSFYTPRTLGYLLAGPAALEIDEPIDWQFADFCARAGRGGVRAGR